MEALVARESAFIGKFIQVVKLRWWRLHRLVYKPVKYEEDIGTEAKGKCGGYKGSYK